MILIIFLWFVVGQDTLIVVTYLSERSVPNKYDIEAYSPLSRLAV